MLFNLTFDQSDANLPASFKAVVNAVAQFFQSHFSAPITINIDVGYGEINNQPLGSGALGESETFLNSYSYAQIRNGLATHAPSADATTALNSLPAGDPIGSAHAYWLATAEAKALGLQGASSSTDGFVGFGNSFPFFYDATHTQAVPAGQYDFFAVVAHEFSEVMGRMLFTGSNIVGTNAYDFLDLFHYSGQNTRDFSGTTPGYFSINGGTTNLDNFNTNPGGDFGDWASSAGHDSFLAFSPSGVLNAISEADLKLLDALGYERSGGATGTPSPGNIAFTGDFNGDL